MGYKFKVTIGIPFYNNIATLKLALSSIFAQSFSDWELILIDDGSTDGSLEIARLVRDPRVRVYADGKNRGLVYRLNQLTHLAQGELFARMDADDIMHRDRILKQVSHFVEHPQFDVIGTSAYSIDDESIPYGIRTVNPISTEPATVLKKGLLIHPTVMGYTEWFRRNPYNPKYIRAEDQELWFRTCTTTRFDQLKEPLLYYREARVNIKNYLLTGKTMRRLFREYGPNVLGDFETNKQIIISYLKSACYWGLSCVKCQNLLVKLRSRKLNDKEMHTVSRMIEEISLTRVPGLAEK